MKGRLVVSHAIDLDLWVILAFEPLDQDQIHATHAREQRRQPEFGLAAQFVHERPPQTRSDENLPGAGLTMLPGVFAGLVNVEAVMSMFQRRNHKPPGGQRRDEAPKQCRLASPAPTRQSDYAHWWDRMSSRPLDIEDGPFWITPVRASYQITTWRGRIAGLSEACPDRPFLGREHNCRGDCCPAVSDPMAATQGNLDEVARLGCS
jgi:hypothetical protein